MFPNHHVFFWYQYIYMNKISRAFPTLNRFARLLSFATINKQSRITSHPRNKALLGDHGEQSLHKALLCWSPKVGFWAPTLTSPGATAKTCEWLCFCSRTLVPRLGILFVAKGVEVLGGELLRCHPFQFMSITIWVEHSVGWMTCLLSFAIHHRKLAWQ